jgi:protein-S-isoprenylcysteine O-methyltransferase Ste14
MYSSLLLGGTGILFKHISVVTVILAIINIVANYLTCREEEKEMRSRFSEEYSDYMTRTKMFIPYLI